MSQLTLNYSNNWQYVLCVSLFFFIMYFFISINTHTNNEIILCDKLQSHIINKLIHRFVSIEWVATEKNKEHSRNNNMSRGIILTKEIVAFLIDRSLRKLQRQFYFILFFLLHELSSSLAYVMWTGFNSHSLVYFFCVFLFFFLCFLF